jgi:hypothetical protein
MTTRLIPSISAELLSRHEWASIVFLHTNVPTWTLMVPAATNLAILDDNAPWQEPRTVTLSRSDPPNFIIDGMWEAHATGLEYPRWVAWMSTIWLRRRVGGMVYD